MTFGWLRSRRFDLSLTAGIAALGVAAGLCAMARPAWLPWLLVLDFWLLGYHHVVATFTRLAFDRASFLEHRGLVTWLPILVVAATCTLAFSVGVWALISTYFYWQAWHYARQSYGLSRIYRRREGTTRLDDRLDGAVIFLVPLAGVLHRSAQGWTRFLNLDIAMVPVPAVAVPGGLALAGIAVAVWLARQVQLTRRGTLAGAHALYLLTHVLIFGVGYVVIPDLSGGWLALNVWHNAQYLLIVWMFNVNRFKAGETAEAPLLSAISQPRAVARYLFVQLSMGTLLFAAILGLPSVKILAVPVVLLLSQTLNFHHYIEDAIIWKVRRPQVRVHLLTRA